MPLCCGAGAPLRLAAAACRLAAVPPGSSPLCSSRQPASQPARPAAGGQADSQQSVARGARDRRDVQLRAAPSGAHRVALDSLARSLVLFWKWIEQCKLSVLIPYLVEYCHA